MPEPATWAQMMIGFGVVGGATRIVWRQRKAREQAEA
ncbi:PEPxxWA-CTERM sorting domain-containing protein [Sphingomonas changnyeongensis]|uniref:PEPxxWA-CTERM sorting domain-containing protein n=1 Tax=Sphingomonas changnyeongensis TaxID=2698679 RepID=A0A7Z2NY10_9SPHN|nr:PEPxxWA-CTERM sorting domain-containing protein [Sphingomonas changnyeongensis]